MYVRRNVYEEVIGWQKKHREREREREYNRQAEAKEGEMKVGAVCMRVEEARVWVQGIARVIVWRMTRKHQRSSPRIKVRRILPRGISPLAILLQTNMAGKVRRHDSNGCHQADK